MGDQRINVPVRLLLSRDLSVPTKLVWMVSKLWSDPGPVRSTWLVQTTSLSRPTVLRSLARLAASGWSTNTGDRVVSYPASLLVNDRLSCYAKVLYGLMQLTPGFVHPSGRFIYADLTKLLNASRHTVGKAVAELVLAEWLKIQRANRLAPVYFELTSPGLERELIAQAAAQNRLEHADPYGEGLMREYLTLLIDSDEYIDNARPGWLINPRTQQLLELDRFYPPHLAFEFNGPQHDRPTKWFTAEQVAIQRERDYVKVGICATRGVTLVTVYPEDLTLKTMEQLVGEHLPLRDLRGFRLLINYLEAESRKYNERIVRI